jgi:hypothetical protein
LYLTGSGRPVRDQIEPRLDRYLDVVGRAQVTGENVKTAIIEEHRVSFVFDHTPESDAPPNRESLSAPLAAPALDLRDHAIEEGVT